MNKIRFASVIVTYRCNARCQMCNIWQYPTRPEAELGLDVYAKLPRMGAVNVTGGEPFLRDDLEDVVGVLKAKCDRLVISSNGWHTDRILALFRKHPDVGLRISIEGMPETNDRVRGLKGGFDRAIRALVELSHMGVRDIGFGMTVGNDNAQDLLPLYRLAKRMKLEFATAALHNSFYFHKFDNAFRNPSDASAAFEAVADELLRSPSPKDWFRAYYNHGLANYVEGKPRLLPCEMGHDAFFLDPSGDVLPCNVMKEPLGNLRERTFEDIWTSARAEEVRCKVRGCQERCWMVGSVAQQMKKRIDVPLRWMLRRKIGLGP